MLRLGLTNGSDGAGLVPIMALVAIGLAGLRWRPDETVAPTRPVSHQLAALIAITAGAVEVSVILRPDLAATLIGPIVTLAVIGTYLALWGYRAVALLRMVACLSMLTWTPVAETVHTVVRASLEQPSDLIYRRLALLNAFGVDDEPWRLFSAELHRGALVVIATVLLAVGANRWRLSGRMLIDLVATATVALVLHHGLILATPIDDYQPTELTQLATNPSLEIAVSFIAVLGLSAIRFRRHGGRWTRRTDDAEQPVALPAATPSTVDRDPVIFALVDRVTPETVSVMLLAGLLPLVLVALGA